MFANVCIKDTGTLTKFSVLWTKSYVKEKKSILGNIRIGLDETGICVSRRHHVNSFKHSSASEKKEKHSLYETCNIDQHAFYCTLFTFCCKNACLGYFKGRQRKDCVRNISRLK